MPGAPRRSGNGISPELIGYVAGLLGILSFVWGFLTWYSNGGSGVSGYSVLGSGAGAAIGLSIAAGLLAAGLVFEKKPLTVAPAALAVAAFLVTLGVLLGKGSNGQFGNVGTGVGLILELVTTILQALALSYAWMLAAGRLRPPKSRAGQPSGQSGWPPAGGFGAQNQQGQFGQQGQFAPPPGQFTPAPPPGGYAPPAQPQYGGGAPSAQPYHEGYARPSAPPSGSGSYGAPSQQPPASQPPAQQPPAQQPPAQEPGQPGAPWEGQS